MSNLFVTVVETPEGKSVASAGVNLCSYKAAKKVADRMNNPFMDIDNGISKAKVGMVCLGRIDDLLKELIPAPVWNGIDNTKKDEYRDLVKAWMNG